MTDNALMPLCVAHTEPAARGIQRIELRHPQGEPLPPFTAGAHIPVRTPGGAMRQYSLCNDPAEQDRYVIAVKREAEGRGGSRSLVDAARPGLVLEVGAPENAFALDPKAGSFVLIAGGIGITPMMAMARHLLAEDGRPFKLYYLTRDAEGTAFRDELRAPPFAPHVVVHHDGGDPANAYDLWPVLEKPGSAAGRHVYCCGPTPLMDAVRDMSGHWPASAVHFESFGADLRPHADDQPFEVQLQHSGARFTVPVGQSILETLRARGVAVASSCESGTCGSCKTRLLSGEADHRDLVLLPEERATHVMVCVSRAKTPCLVLDLNPIRLGVLGLGRAFTLMLPTFTGDARVRLVAGFDPRPEARDAFAQQLGGTAHDSVAAVCADPAVEWVYVATPHQLHADHVVLAAQHGKHVLVEKPMAIALADCDRMIAACEAAGTQLIVGHSHSFNAPVLLAHRLIGQGRIGAVRFVHAMQYTDFLYRPRRPEELDTARGGGVVFSQAAHQMDIVRLLAGGMARSVRAHTGRWDPARPTEGAYSALITFDNGAFASATYNGYGHYDTDVLMGGIGELGTPKAADAHAKTRARLAQTTDEVAEAELKAQRNFGGRLYQAVTPAPPAACQHFGPVIVSGDRGDLRLTPTGVEVHDAQGVRVEPCTLPAVPRAEVIDELWSVAREGQPPLHGGRWSRATLELCLALLQSQASGTDIILKQQVPPG